MGVFSPRTASLTRVLNNGDAEVPLQDGLRVLPGSGVRVSVHVSVRDVAVHVQKEKCQSRSAGRSLDDATRRVRARAQPSRAIVRFCARHDFVVDAAFNHGAVCYEGVNSFVHSSAPV